MKAELDALLENGWKLDEEQIRLEKTYHFKTYTKVAVSKTYNGEAKANFLGLTPHNRHEKQIGQSPFYHDNCKDPLPLYLYNELIVYRSSDLLLCIGRHIHHVDSPTRIHVWRNTVTNKQRALGQLNKVKVNDVVLPHPHCDLRTVWEGSLHSWACKSSLSQSEPTADRGTLS